MCAILTRAPPGALPELTTSAPLARGAAFRGRPDQFLSRASHLRCSPATCLSLSFCQKMFRCNLVVGLFCFEVWVLFSEIYAARPVFSPDRLTSGLSYPLYCPPVWVCVCVLIASGDTHASTCQHNCLYSKLPAKLGFPPTTSACPQVCLQLGGMGGTGVILQWSITRADNTGGARNVALVSVTSNAGYRPQWSFLITPLRGKN